MRRANTLNDFWRFVTPGSKDECWLWRGGASGRGYGSFNMNGKTYGAHRISWQLATGQDASALDVLHKCDVPKCVNPAHLFVGTHDDNMKDKVAKMRQPRGEKCANAKLTDAHIKIIKYVGKTLPRRVLANEFGINRQAVSNILNGRKWAHVEVVR